MKPTITPLVLSTATFGLMLGIAQNAQAALIPGISVSSSLGVDPEQPWNIDNTVNGQGLLAPPGNTPSLTGNHTSSQDIATAWRSAELTEPQGTTISGEILFDLNGTYSVSGFTFWNFGGANIFLASQGIRDVTVEYFDGTSWLPVIGAPTTFALGQIGDVTTQQLPQTFSFAPVTAQQIRFVNLSNFTNAPLGGSNNKIGFSEVQFNEAVPAQIPEPSSLLALLAVGLGGVSLRKRI
ncbi:MAG: PEP-CTERM sorting domain-containing protein [Microcystis aeruginosa Ma_MB_S_20031200_S102]|uniref:PEP-CTERM sorting domain-containing protein n=1 Tax=Microcystis aeruginosa Ma_MB_S_20031200_S102 TaxID=2486254 RepID=A0A552EZX3_MICAE|nr:MAG: PEP-CTERM sorting domain-containing protein [Microcystis aeruginosa Ma_MB_S_20031200_S102D]TRU40014.1 MAG: PEP-CTERM sorting domain-containing protein [Microcystis aeruginosa Ma_MB_S_20031200_S102]